ncbi:MAG: hypothetical protein JWN98_2437 [Abditibacteriota bacterium]|jgi:hypothetical protein|nr:hypothetical protein [Abditibacteriota bacterium]
MSFEQQDEWQAVEESLRAAAPQLPPTLKSRTLARCAAHVHQERRLRQRGSKRLMWALATVFVFQWALISLLDWQHTTLISPTTANERHQYAGNSGAQSDSAAVWKKLKVRSHTLSALMANRSEWPVTPEPG